MERASSIIESLNLTKKLEKTPNYNDDNARYKNSILKKIRSRYVGSNRIKKPSSNIPIVKYFQSISKNRIRSATKPLPDSITKSLNYLPFSKDQLICRINSFKDSQKWDLNYLNKLTVLKIARYGWFQSGRKNELWCKCCNERFSIKFPETLNNNDEDNDQLIDKLQDRYQELLAQSHKDTCPWKVRNTPELVYKIELNDIFNQIDHFENLYRHNLSFVKDFNGLKIDNDDDLNLNNIIKWLSLKELDINIYCILITLFNWKLNKISNNLLFESITDNRRFITSLSNDKDSGIEPINLLDEHYSWCDYVEGYKIVLQMFEILTHDQSINGNDDNNNDNDNDSTNDDENIDNETRDYDANNDEKFLEKMEQLRKIYLDD
ncbi:hypothetical protein WICMUC_004560 [Wickerhamomyces mucosus]|uniref:C3HC-type domain-containing protein n=1 Tax=Wickerhamomyces mucosus TaxID=1378264 RepID=A0A9P8PIB9_9ASCO|nr:hypothetical protein WICMUC_004560 [Wickerhamomyces mucosus]